MDFSVCTMPKGIVLLSVGETKDKSEGAEAEIIVPTICEFA
jgi:hypothetical protein